MIISNFSIVSYIDQKFGNITIQDEKISIHYSGTDIYQTKKNIDINGKVLLNWMEGTNRLYLVLNENKIYSLDKYSGKEVLWIICHPEIVKSVTNLTILESFILL